MKLAARLNGKYPPVNFEELETVPGVRTFAVHVPPDVARRLLERNARNLKVSARQVESHVARIRSADSTVDSEVIAFDRQGILVTGQNQLTAIVVANRTVPCLVTLHLPDPVTGAAAIRPDRSPVANDGSGQQQYHRETEIAQFLAHLSAGGRALPASPERTVTSMLDRHRQSIRLVIDIMLGDCKKVSGFSDPGFLAAAVLYHEIEPDRCVEFLNGVRTGVRKLQAHDGSPPSARCWQLLENRHPASHLRHFLLGLSGRSDSIDGRLRIFRNSIFAMQAHLAGDMISGLREAEGFEGGLDSIPSPASARHAGDIKCAAHRKR